MKSTMKTRILAMLLVVIMVVALVPANVFAAETAPALPEAEATVTGRDITVMTMDGEEVPVTFAMNFKAVAPSDEQYAYYQKWYADYVPTVNKDVTGMDGYLVGQYDQADPDWIKIAVETEDVVIKANEPFKVMYNLGQMINEKSTYISYEDIINYVQDFDCGIYFTPEFLQANPDLEVTLELRIYNLHDMEENYRIGDAYVFTPDIQTERPELPGASAIVTGQNTTVTTIDGTEVPVTFTMNFKVVDPSDEQYAYYDDWFADYVLTINKDVRGVDAYLVGQYDAFNSNWVQVGMDTEDVIIKANEPMNVMYTLGKLINESSTYIKYSDIVNIIKEFDCGIYFTPEFLQANPDLEVSLELKMYNPSNMEESYTIGNDYTFTAPSTLVEIVTQPTDQVVKLTGTATFNVEATGAVSYHWQRIKKGATEWTNISGATEPSYSVKVTTYTMLPYRCVLTDAEGNEYITDEVTIVLPDPLVNILNNAGNIHVIKNSVINYHVVLDSTEGVTYQWQRFKNGSWRNVSYSGNQTDTVTFVAASWAQYPFRCEITDANGTKIYTEDYTYTLEEPPVNPAIVTNPKNAYVHEGEIATFSVEAVGSGLVENGVDPGLNYQWWRSKNGGETFGEYTADDAYTNSISLKIHAGEEFLYFCEIKDGYGNTLKSTVVQPILVDGVVIVSQPTDAVADKNGVATFSVTATGDVKTYQWERLKSHGWVDASDATNYVGNNTATMSTKVKGTYRCRITDTSGIVTYTDEVTFPAG